jgi:hypothetical protein
MKPQPEPTRTAPLAENPPVVRPAAIEMTIETIVVEIPLGPTPSGYVSSHLNSQLTVPQATGVARLAAGLRQSGTKMSNGRPVLFNADAVRWLLEQIAAA